MKGQRPLVQTLGVFREPLPEPSKPGFVLLGVLFVYHFLRYYILTLLCFGAFLEVIWWTPWIVKEIFEILSLYLEKT